MKNILITGGLGFIGTNLVRRLQNNHHISIIDNLSNLLISQSDIRAKENIIIGDIQNYQDCLKATRDIDVIIHLAAKGNVVESVNDPLDNFENNVIGTFNILRSAQVNGIKRVILASTGGALMGNCELPVSETSLPHPIAPYGASKMAGEGYAHAFANAYNMSTTIVRFANIYGPYSLHKKGLVNKVMSNIKQGQATSIYGKEISRDFLYVDDLCLGIDKILSYEHEGSEIFHLASGVESSIKKVVQNLYKIAGKESLPIHILSERKGEVTNNVASYHKAQKILKFEPEVELYQGLKMTWEWFETIKQVHT